MADYQLSYTGTQVNTLLGKANTAVQPATLSDYSTTSQMNTAISNHHDSTKADASALSSYALLSNHQQLVFTLQDDTTVTIDVVTTGA